MSYKALVCKIEEIWKHPNADRLQIARVAGGYEVIVGLDSKQGDLGVYFDTDGQLSDEFLRANDLYARKDPATNKKIGGGFFDSSRRVRAQGFRGVKSYGFFVPPSYFKWIEDRTGLPVELKEGSSFDSLHNIVVCNKYFNRRTASQRQLQARTPNRKDYRAYTCFKQHIDTEKLKDRIRDIPYGALLIITIKEHGTSAVTGYVPVVSRFSDVDLRPARSLLGRLAKAFKNNFKRVWRKELDYFTSPRTEYQFLVGTRNVVLQDGARDGFYQDTFRWVAADNFRGKLRKGETIYYEIVGYTSTGAPLMGTHSLAKLKKEYANTSKFPEEMVYKYGCVPGEHRISVYRITMTDEEGNSFDLSWDQVKYRCNELGVKPVIEVERCIYDGNARDLIDKCNLFKSEDDLKPSLIDPSHIEEGVVVRVEDGRPTPLFMKDKSFLFGVLEGFWKDNPDNVDAEEVEASIELPFVETALNCTE